MKPRDLLLGQIERHLLRRLEAIGFVYSPSKLSFSRKVAIARQEITFSLSKWNSDDDCTFWTMWGARAPAYSKWHKDAFGKPPANNALGGAADWNIPGWSRQKGALARLRNTADDAAVLHALVKDFVDVGVPFLNSISSWLGAAERLLVENWFFARAIDFFILAGDMPRARETLVRGLRAYTRDGRADQSGDLADLRIRVRKFFPDAESFETGG